MSIYSTQVVKDLKEKSILVSREFDAPVELVWRAFTESEILDRWWGPAPWRAETKFQDFSVGGYWLYAMVSPENEKHWARMNYLSIDKFKNFQLEDAFCDENGIINSELPVSKGINEFTVTKTGTKVEFKMTYSTKEQLQAIIAMGFEEGITICLEQLNQLIINSKI
ncbi:MAG: SRPBCC domain-containing protein [Candidatus Kapabacteria bacterium]|nr:SRPBCC domain-containing protein [Candidatus Kapabacteria bacterium]